jgi:malonyl-CoA O-methyltransferase
MRDQFAQAAASYDEAAVLAREVGSRMAERLDYVKIAPARLADIGCATGDGIRELQRRYPRALQLAIDFALPMLAAIGERSGRLERLRGKAPLLVNADVRTLPLAGNCLGLVWSNLMLHWLEDPLPAFRELHRVTEVSGLLTFSILGPDTLKEVRRACADLGIAPPLRRFHDMHDIGDMLVAAGFADPVMDMEMITFTYAGPRGLLRDQRQLGVRVGLFGQLPWRDWRRVFRHYAAQRIDGRLPATFEVIYGHAWKPAPRQADDGRAIIHFEPRRT